MDWLAATATDLFNILGRVVFTKLFMWAVLAFPVVALFGYLGLVRKRRRTEQKEHP
jgi:hypothetical protein